MCTHEYILCDNLETCMNCGLVNDFFIDPANTSYDDRPNIPLKKNYSRKDRFMRLFQNLRGLQHIPHEIMDEIPPDITLIELRILFSFLRESF